jgi:glycine oxidase
MREQIVAVIGGGVVGLTTALALQAPDRRIHLIERDAAPARRSSWAGGGIVCPLRPWREPDALWPLIDRSRALYPVLAAQLQRETGIDIEYRLTGIEWQVDGKEREQAMAWLSARGLPVETPEDRLRCPELGQVRNPRLGRALAMAFQRRGGTMHCGHAARPWIEGQRARGIQFDGGVTLTTDAVVVAAGAWSGDLLDGPAPEIFPVKGQMLLKRVAGADTRPVIVGQEVYLIPRADGHLLIGSTVEHVGFDTSVTEAARRWLLDAADRLAPWQSDAPVLRQWAGLRPGAHSSVPVIGHGGASGLWLNLGHYRNGIALAPACAEDLCQRMGYQSSLSPP